MQRAVDGGGGGGGSGGRAAQMIGEYKEKVEGELKDICAEVLVRTTSAGWFCKGRRRIRAGADIVSCKI